MRIGSYAAGLLRYPIGHFNDWDVERQIIVAGR